ncbi:hypothetical protein ABG79_00622 [Caloramator mitchellensis]|uniref:Uncharacterized protein n=1 Tax=Caloramator mitchellensis TaxID=908809 RepID=A0A0R3JW84_CALMK|nr:hypothetical protein [Caloramator mitchellensis]KRQ87817.1 hypothetical protein ABG79_00622 [Caloramator mitchellensis]
MKDINVKETMHEMLLRQMGAKVICYVGKQCYVKFNIEGYEISYAYNINSKEKYFLQRVKPYPMVAGVFEDLKDVVTLIEIDVEQFRNVISSGKFEKFLELNKKILDTARNLEDLFLYYKVDEKMFDEIMKEIDDVREKIMNSAAPEKRVYFKKDPETL